jgi:hypothetical protein
MASEKRRFTRFSFPIKAELTVGNKGYIIEKFDNLSIGGCLVKLPENFELETPCSLTIDLHMTGEKPVINIKGLIVRSENSQIAINFTGIDPESLFHLQRIALYNSSEPEKVEEEINEHPGII